MAAQDDSIKARMTCIGQSNLCASAEYVHFQCTHQPIHGAHVCSLQVIQRSLLLSPWAVVGFLYIYFMSHQKQFFLSHLLHVWRIDRLLV